MPDSIPKVLNDSFIVIFTTAVFIIVFDQNLEPASFAAYLFDIFMLPLCIFRQLQC
jgi:hypothetical protein